MRRIRRRRGRTWKGVTGQVTGAERDEAQDGALRAGVRSPFQLVGKWRQARRGRDDYVRLLSASKQATMGSVTRKLEADPSADVQAELAAIDGYRKALDEQAKPWRADIVWSFVAASTCVGTLAALAAYPIDRADIALSIVADAIEVTAASDWGNTPALVMSKPFTISGAGTADLGDLDPKVGVVTAPTAINVATSDATLSLRPISSGDVLRLACTDNGFELSFLGREGDFLATTSSDVRLSTSSPLLGGRDLERQAGAGVATIRFRSAPGKPLAVKGHSSDLRLSLSGPVSALSFAADGLSSSGASRFTSSVRSGTAVVGAIDKRYQLLPHDDLSLTSAAGSVAITTGGKCMEARFAGSAAAVGIGRKPFVVNAVPSRLAYLFRKEGLPYYLTIFGTLWGVLWGGMSWLRSRVA